MKVLLIGGSGQLGSEIRRRWTTHDISAPAHAELPLEDAAAFAQAVRSRPFNAVVNCAAFHNVDLCEDEPAKAFTANSAAPALMASECFSLGIPFVTVSTDYVFSGTSSEPYTEDSAPHPISAYGTSKYAGELLVQQRHPGSLIVRTCGVYGIRPSATKGHTFIDRVISQAKRGEPLRVVSDVVASPTYAGDLAVVLGRLLDSEARGLVHAVNAGAVSWYDFARHALEAAGLNVAIEPVPQSTWPTKAARPKYSALTSTRLAKLGIPLPDWRSGIESYLRDKAALDVST